MLHGLFSEHEHVLLFGSRSKFSWRLCAKSDHITRSKDLCDHQYFCNTMVRSQPGKSSPKKLTSSALVSSIGVHDNTDDELVQVLFSEWPGDAQRERYEKVRFWKREAEPCRSSPSRGSLARCKSARRHWALFSFSVCFGIVVQRKTC